MLSLISGNLNRYVSQSWHRENDVVPDIYFPTASNALRISDDTVPGIGEDKAGK